MNRTIFFLLSLLFVVSGIRLSLGQPEQRPFAPPTDDPSLPRVLLLGDSISIGYTIPVRQMLRRQANVHRAPENCGPTLRGLEKLDQWLGDRRWDVIHFNFGLHDLKYINDQGARVDPSEGHIQVTGSQYGENLRKIIRRLEQTGAKLIWCTTTPVPEGAKGRVPGDAARYNRIAADVVRSASGLKIAVNDLYAFSLPRLGSIQRKADVHFHPEGSRQLAIQVAEKIRETLRLPSPTPELARGVVFEDVNRNRVFDEEDLPLENVRVSNGEQIVSTDSHGFYVIPIRANATLFVIKPRGYRTPLNSSQLPQFYYTHKPEGSPAFRFRGVAPTGALPPSVDFPLYRQKEPPQFKALMFGDPQPRTQEEVDFIAHDVVEELIGTDASFGVTLGDVVFDDLSLFESQARMIALLGIPWYNVIGNHDLNFDAKNDEFSDESFERVFGPAYYSFDYGPVHFLVLDDVEWYIDQVGEGRYRGGLGPRQMEFIRNDLAAIPPEQLVVLMMHIPLTDVGDRQQLYRLIEKRPFCMSISAHTHRHEHRMIGKEDGWMGAEPHHHVVNVTVSGSWWSGARDERNIPHTIMTDGAPNGYSILTFNGNEYRLDFKAAGRPADYQMSIHAPEVVSVSDLDKTDVYANVFNGSVDTRVTMRLRGQPQWHGMEKTEAEDPYFRRIYHAETRILKQLEATGQHEKPWTPLGRPRVSSHLWKAKLPTTLQAGTHVIQVRAIDRHGRKYHGKRIMRVRE